MGKEGEKAREKMREEELKKKVEKEEGGDEE